MFKFLKRKKKPIDKFVFICKPLDYFLNVICNPRMWLPLEGSSKSTSKIVKNLINLSESDELKLKTTIFRQHTIKFTFDDDEFIEIWISNYPYSYGSIYRSSPKYSKLISSKLPTRYTKLLLNRFRKKNITDILKKEEAERTELIKSLEL